MGFPLYLFSFGVPLVVGLLGIGLYIMNNSQPASQMHHRPNRSICYERYRQSTFSEGDRCSICLEEMTTNTYSKLECGHRLHSSCLVELYKRNQKTCPECRAEIKF